MMVDEVTVPILKACGLFVRKLWTQRMRSGGMLRWQSFLIIWWGCIVFKAELKSMKRMDAKVPGDSRCWRRGWRSPWLPFQVVTPLNPLSKITETACTSLSFLPDLWGQKSPCWCYSFQLAELKHCTLPTLCKKPWIYLFKKCNKDLFAMNWNCRLARKSFSVMTEIIYPTTAQMTA